jgi:alpha-ketoglutarate-dependent taurine dioxygenase
MTTTSAAQDHSGGWYAADLSKQDLCMDFTPAHLAAIDELVQAIRKAGLRFHEIEKRHFCHPALDDFLADVLRRMKSHPGIVVLRNFPVDRYPLAEIEAIYWGIGTHFGVACSQSTSGDLIGHVTDKGTSRGYTGSRALAMHADSAELVGLLCIRRSKEGGENILASSLKIYDIVRREHPEYLPILERGFPYHRRGEEALGEAPITPYDVPIFSFADGYLTCRCTRERIDLALRELERTLTPLEEAALDFFESIGWRDEVGFRLQLEPGELLFINNFEMLHSRTAFVDWEDPAQKRLLLRLWIEGEPRRPIKREALTFQNRSGRLGIDPQEGRQAGRAEFMPIVNRPVPVKSTV